MSESASNEQNPASSGTNNGKSSALKSLTYQSHQPSLTGATAATASSSASPTAPALSDSDVTNSVQKTSDEYKEGPAPSDSALSTAASIIAAQGECGVRPFVLSKLEYESMRNWDRFYKRNEDRFYKDRHYLTNEFRALSDILDADRRRRNGEAETEGERKRREERATGEIVEREEITPVPSPDSEIAHAAAAAASPSPSPSPSPSSFSSTETSDGLFAAPCTFTLPPPPAPPAIPQAGQRRLIEVGCGVGNAMFPLLRLHPDMFFYGLDCSARAIAHIQKQEEYIGSRRASVIVADVVDESWPKFITQHGPADFATLIFVLSAIHPDKMPNVLKNIHRALKPDEGLLFMRDYCLFDLAQLRFAKTSKLGPNWYVRQDGTRSYFFSLDSLTSLLQSCGFAIVDAAVVCKLVVNRKTNEEMSRRFVQITARAVTNVQQHHQFVHAQSEESISSNGAIQSTKSEPTAPPAQEAPNAHSSS